MLDSLFLWWHGAATRVKMNRVFSRAEDPYGYQVSSYELARLDAMGHALGTRTYGNCLEIGCAEGAFTERLSRIGEVMAVDISPVALTRARTRLAGHPRVSLFEADIRGWTPPAGKLFDLIVVGDVLYYLDKPLVRAAMEQTFDAIASWLSPGGRLILAHGFAGSAEKNHRRGFRLRFERLGLVLVVEQAIGDGMGTVQCLLSVLEKPRASADVLESVRRKLYNDR